MIVATIAVVIAVPFGVLAALFITDYSDARTRRYLTALVDLLAAVPSLLYGIWGFLVLSKEIAPLSNRRCSSRRESGTGPRAPAVKREPHSARPSSSPGGGTIGFPESNRPDGP